MFQVGSEDWNDVLFTGQRIRWMKDPQTRPSIKSVEQRAIARIGGDPNRKEHEGRSPLYSYNAYKVQTPSGSDKLVTKQDTVPVLLQVCQMCFKGSFSNN